MIGYPRTLLLFYRRHLRVQPLRELMAVAGVAAGVALLFAVQVAHRSLAGSFEEVAHGVAGDATLELAARGPEGFDGRIAEEVQRMAGVKAAAPILTQPVVAVGPSGRRALTLVGATEQIDALHGRLSTAFQRAGEASRQGLLLLTAPTARALGVRPGGSVTVLVAGRSERMRVAATVGAGAIGAAAQAPIAAAPLAIVQSVAGLPGRVSRVLIEPRPGAEASVRRELAARFGGAATASPGAGAAADPSGSATGSPSGSAADARPIDTEARLLGNAAASESQVTLLFSAISLVAGVILAYNALLLASAERRRFVAYLIRTGTPDSMVLASLAFDALILGLAGCALGLLAGELISLLAYGGVPGYIAAAFAVGPQRVVAAQTVLIALAGGLLAAFAAALLPAVAILRSGALGQPEAVGRALAFTRRLRPADRGVFAAGLALAGGAVLAALLAPATTVAALVGLAAGIVVCLPMAARALLAAAHRAARRSSDAALRLAVAELRGSATRPVALLATGAIAAFLMVTIGGSVADVQSAVRTGAGDLLSSAQVWVRPGGPENVYTTQPFASAQAQRRIARLRDVRSVSAWQDSFLDLPGRRVWVLGVPPAQRDQIAPSQLLEGSLASADAHLRAGGWAALSQTLARERHLRLGQPFELPTPAGPASFRLAAVTANYGWLSGAVVMNADDHARLWRSDKATELAVALKEGVPPSVGRQEVEAALGAGSPTGGGAATAGGGAATADGGAATGAPTSTPTPAALTEQTSAQRRAEVSAVLGSTLSRLNDTTLVVLVTTLASVVALMMAAVWQSRGRFNSLISIGMSFGQFARLIFYECGIVLLGGCAIGIAAGLTGQYLIDGWLHHTTGSPVRFAPAWQLGARTAAVAVAIALVASLAAALRAVGFQPREAFATE
jgi:putative ABC transport system permease protein